MALLPKYKLIPEVGLTFSLFIFLSILSLKISEYIEFEKRKQTW